MSDNYHTPIATGANANAAIFNAPLGQLDQAITDMLDSSQEFEALLAGVGALDLSALMTLISTNKGFLPPRMTAAQKNAIASPATGLMLFDTTNVEPQVYDGSAWGGFSGSGIADMVLLESGAISSTTQKTITGISQNYQDLCLRLRVRSNYFFPIDPIFLRFNNLSSAGAYLWMQVLTQGANSPQFFNSTSDTEIEIRVTGQSISPTTRFTDIDIWIRNYTQNNRIQGDFMGAVELNSHGDTYGAFEFVSGGPITRIDILRPTNGFRGSYALYGLGRQGEIEMLDFFSVPSGPPLASPLVTDNTGTWVFVQTDGQFSIT